MPATLPVPSTSERLIALTDVDLITRAYDVVRSLGDPDEIADEIAELYAVIGELVERFAPSAGWEENVRATRSSVEAEDIEFELADSREYWAERAARRARARGL